MAVEAIPKESCNHCKHHYPAHLQQCLSTAAACKAVEELSQIICAQDEAGRNCRKLKECELREQNCHLRTQQHNGTAAAAASK